MSNRARTRAIRDRMATTSERFTAAARHVDTTTGPEPAAAAVVDEALLQPYPDELVPPPGATDGWRPVTTAELGWRALPPDATPEQRARTESVWRPVTAARPCRCSGHCLHGQPCRMGDDGVDSCPGGRLLHLDRQAASVLIVTGWIDAYACDTCDEQFDTGVELPDVPWGEREGPAIYEYPGVRRVIVVDDTWPDDSPCPDCGNHYRCRCDDEHGCPECGAGGAGAPYEECVCYQD